MKGKLIAIGLVLYPSGAIFALMMLEGAPLRVAASFAFVVAFLFSFAAINSLERNAGKE